MPEKCLIIITGPVAAGKSTVALHVGRNLRVAGLRTAVMDLDELYLMARQREDFGDLGTWETARLAAADLARGFYGREFAAVVVEGGVHSRSEYADLTDLGSVSVHSLFVTLLVSPREALRRAQDDPHPDRVFSRRPDVQEVLYAHFQKALPFLQASSVVLNAEDVGPEELAGSISDLVIASVQAEGS